MEGKQVNFICFNKAYPIELPIFNKHSSFFLSHEEIDEKERNVELLSSYDFCTSHTKESVEAFLNYCQDREIKIEVNNVVSIESLSIKYYVKKLSQLANQFIEEHSKEVIEYFLSNKESKSPKYEELISKHFIEYSTDDRLYQLPISTLYRIEQRFVRETKKEEETNSKRIIIDFLIKAVTNIGEESSIFISSHKFNQEDIIYLNERIDNIKDYDAKEILITFLQKNASFIIETRIKEKEEKRKEKRKYEKRIKRLEDEISLLYCNFDFKKPINLPNSPIFQREFEGYPFTEIMLPNNIEIIGSKSFKDCLSLKKITIPTSTRTIGSKSFSGCSSLKEINIPPSVTTIGSKSFSGCSSLKEINIPPSVTTIGSKSFSGCSLLKEINIPPSVTTIGENIFEGCNEIIISPNMTQIPNQLFNKCSSLAKITIPKTITTISSKSFIGCSLLKEINIPQSVTTICESSFEGCSSLTKITIPSSIKTIEMKSFKECNKLEEIRIDCKTEVYPSSFDNCQSLKRLIISASKVISEEANKDESSVFFQSNIDSTIFNTISIEEQETILKIIKNIKMNKIKAKEEKVEKILDLLTFLKKEKQKSNNTKSISKESFVQIVKNDEQILIKFQMTNILIKNQIFEKEEFMQQVNKLECIFIEVKYKSSEFDTIYNKLVSFKKNKIPKLKIAIFITEIKSTDQYFHGNKDISCVTLDKCVTKIESSRFDGSFENCKSLEYISIPSSVTQIGNCAFDSCSSLTQITIPSSVTQIGDSAFYSCSSLTQITIPSSVTQIGNCAFYSCSSLTQITIPSSVTQIGNCAFYSCSSLTQITIPSSVTQIGNCAFYSCSSLTQITIPSSVTQIGDRAFSSCSSLRQITIPSSVTQIRNCSFSSCSSLTQITIPSSVTQIGDRAFSSCSSLRQITIPSSVTQIGDRAFDSCSSLTQITIPQSLNISGTGIGSKVRVIRVKGIVGS